MLIHEIQEVTGNVVCHVLVESGVEPYKPLRFLSFICGAEYSILCR